MNCFSHAYRFLDHDPHFVIGTCVPDWLSMVARKTRVREKVAAQRTADDDPRFASLAAGIVQHHRDDHWFHGLREFVELNLAFAIELRELLGADAGFRPHLVGHISIEVLLDSFLHEAHPGRLEAYYKMVDSVNPVVVQQGINRIAAVPTDRIVSFLPLFVRERYLFDYVEDERVRYRLNRVLKRIGLVELPRGFLDWLPNARRRVYDVAPVLLTPPVVGAENGLAGY